MGSWDPVGGLVFGWAWLLLILFIASDIDDLRREDREDGSKTLRLFVSWGPSGGDQSRLAMINGRISMINGRIGRMDGRIESGSDQATGG